MTLQRLKRPPGIFIHGSDRSTIALFARNFGIASAASDDRRFIHGGPQGYRPNGRAGPSCANCIASIPLLFVRFDKSMDGGYRSRGGHDCVAACWPPECCRLDQILGPGCGRSAPGRRRTPAMVW